MKLNKKKLKINYEYFIPFFVFLTLIISFNFLKIDTSKTYKFVLKNGTFNFKIKNITELNDKIEIRYNENFIEFFNDKVIQTLKKQIIDKYKNKIISIRISDNKMIILSKVEIDEAFIYNFINSEFEKYKSMKIIKDKKFYFCSKEFNSQANITNLIVDLIDMDRAKELVNFNNSNIVVICNNDMTNNKIIFMDFKKISKIIEGLKFHKSFVIKKREFNRNTKQWNLLMSLIISYVFFMIIRFSK